MKGSPIFVPGLVLLFLATFLGAEPPKRVSLKVRPHCMLFADKIEFTNAAKTVGKAEGGVFVDLTAAYDPMDTRLAWAETVAFDLDQGTLTLRGWPRLIYGKSVHEANNKSTCMVISLKIYKTETYGPAKTDILEFGDPGKSK